MINTASQLNALPDKEAIHSFSGEVAYVNDPTDKGGKTTQRISVGTPDGTVSVTLYNIGRVLTLDDKGKEIILKSNNTKSGLGGVSVSKNGQYTNLFVNSIATVDLPFSGGCVQYQGGTTPANTGGAQQARPAGDLTAREFVVLHYGVFKIVDEIYGDEIDSHGKKDIATSCMIQFKGRPPINAPDDLPY